MAKRGPGISGAALAFVGAGAWLIYAGVKDVPIVDGLRQVLRGETPTGSATKLDLSIPARVGAAAGIGLSSAPATGNIVTAPGTSIRVDASIAPAVGKLVADAKAAGISFGGGGYRSSLQQAQTRIANGCTCSDRSDCCKPPTAPVGQSMHEKGLAIDFTEGGRSLSSSSAGYRWLVANASKYGLRNLPGEPWHWSTNGR